MLKQIWKDVAPGQMDGDDITQAVYKDVAAQTHLTGEQEIDVMRDELEAAFAQHEVDPYEYLATMLRDGFI